METHTFVIPVYQQSPHLEACIQSLVQQTVKSKILITTPTPSAYTKNIADKYNIPYIINNSDKPHVADNFNFALSKGATGLVTLAHQDDIYDIKYAESIIKGFSTNRQKKILIAFTNYTDLVDGELRKFSLSAFAKSALLVPFVFSKTISSFFFKRSILLFGNPICCPTVTFNMDTIGEFGFSAEYTGVVDWHAWYSLTQYDGSFLYINQKLIKRRIHSLSDTTALLNNGVSMQEDRKMFEIIWGNKKIAQIMTAIYAGRHKSNRV